VADEAKQALYEYLLTSIKEIKNDRAQLRADLDAYLSRITALSQAQDVKIGYLQEEMQKIFILLEKKERPKTGPLLDAISTTGRMIARHFSENELRDLCIDLRISYESIEGSTPDAKAKELAAFMARRQEIGRLVKRCVELRPRVYGWPLQYIEEY
jgi:hypothetical protein